MEDLYFANKVIRSRQFLRYAKYHSDQLGCHVSNLYFLDNCIYVFRMIDGKYVSFNGEEYEEFNNVMANELKTIPVTHKPEYTKEHYTLVTISSPTKNVPSIKSLQKIQMSRTFLLLQLYFVPHLHRHFLLQEVRILYFFLQPKIRFVNILYQAVKFLYRTV